MKNLKVLNNQEEFDSLYPDGNVPSKDIAYVKSTKEVVFSTNNVDGTFEQVRATEGGGFDPEDLSIYATKEEVANDISTFITDNDVSNFIDENDASKYVKLDGHNIGNLMVGDNSSTHTYSIGSRKLYNNEESISQFLNDGYKTNISNRVGSTVNSRILLDANGATIQFSGDAHTAYSSGQLERIATQEWVELDVSLKLDSKDVSQFLTSADMSSYATKQDISTFCTLSEVQSEGYLKDNDVSIYVTESQLSNEVSTFITDNDTSLFITENDLNYETWIFTLSDDSSISKNIVVK